MTNGMTRSLIEQLVRGKLKELKESPERTTRNLVDMALPPYWTYSGKKIFQFGNLTQSWFLTISFICSKNFKILKLKLKKGKTNNILYFF